jgi:ABC-type multidrug transport system fused ATPase/permease subunit
MLFLHTASFTASFLTLYVVLTLYGSSLLYKEVAQVGCDPSASVVDNEACGDSAPKVFAAMMGVAFAAQGVASFGNCLGMIEDARVAAAQAQQAMQRQPGAASEVIYQENSTGDDQTEEKGHGDDSDVDDGNLEHSSPRRFSRTWVSQRSDRRSSSTSEQRQTGRRKRSVLEQPLSGANGRKVKGILPTYEIDSMSPTGLKPINVHGAISIKDVHFSYPTRPNVQVFDGISAEIKAASIVAFVGPSGGGCVCTVDFLL